MNKENFYRSVQNKDEKLFIILRSKCNCCVDSNFRGNYGSKFVETGKNFLKGLNNPRQIKWGLPHLQFSPKRSRIIFPFSPF